MKKPSRAMLARGVRWISLGQNGRMSGFNNSRKSVGQPLCDWELAGLLLQGVDVFGLVTQGDLKQ